MFYLSFNSDFCVSKIMHKIYELGIFHAHRTTKCLRNQDRTKGEAWSTTNYLKTNFIAGRPKAALLFWIFGGFRYGVPLFIVILVIYKYKNR